MLLKLPEIKKATWVLLSFMSWSACGFNRHDPAIAVPSVLQLPKSETKAGTGLIHFSMHRSLRLFRSAADSIPYDSLLFEVAAAGADKGRILFKTTVLKDRLQPYTLYGGDSESEGERHRNMGLIRFVPELVFRVVEKADRGVVVLINEKTFETSFIPVDPVKDLRTNTTADDGFFDPNFVSAEIPDWFYYETWAEALRRAWHIDFDTSKVYDRPGGGRISFKGDIPLRVDTVEGAWLRLLPRYGGTGSGWVQWLVNDQIVVGITLNGGYE